MKFKILFFSVLLVGLFACKKDSDTSDPVGPTEDEVSASMSDLNVPDGFNYSVMRPVTFDLTTVDSTGEREGDVIIRLIGISKGENIGLFYSGISQDNGKFQTTVDVPNHITDVVVNTSKAGNIRNFEFSLGNNEVDEALYVNGNNLNSIDDRGLNCYPQIVGIFSDDGKLVGISSSDLVAEIKLAYSDGSEEILSNTYGEVQFSIAAGEICDNGIDDDGDGLIDCADPHCGSDVANCNGSIPCISSFYQIIGKTLQQLDPTTGQYTLVGDLPNAFDTYNGAGYNLQDSYIYGTGKINSTGKVYLVRIYSNANITNMGELVGFEGRSYTGDIDDNGNWTNFYYKGSTWYMAQVDIDAPSLSFVSTEGIDNGAGNVNHHDWVYNATCDKFYTMQAGGGKVLVADHKASPPTVSVAANYSGLDGGAYGAAWSDTDGNLYFSNNGTGNIYKIDMGGNCTPGNISIVLNGAANGNNDGMSCPYSPSIEFGGPDYDGDGVTDNAELLTGTNPTDGCDPVFEGPTCDGIINYSFVGKGTADKVISYVVVTPNCDAPEELTIISNDDVDNDLDNDGVPNATDPDPLDPNKTFVQYAPSANNYGTYAFEDLWPEQGDYDFNDFVVQVQEKIVTNSTNDIYEIIYDCRIMAMGGIFNNTFGISVPDPNDEAQVEFYSVHNTTHESYQRAGYEVVILKHPKALFYSNDLINSQLTDPYFNPIEFQVVIEMNGSVKYPSGYSASFFIEQHGIAGHEIHLPSVQPTSNMNTSLYGSINDDTDPNSGKFFLTPTNLPWGLYVPTEWQYPLEGEEILNAYTQFDDYAQSNPALPWYQSNGSNVNNGKIYTGH